MPATGDLDRLALAAGQGDTDALEQLLAIIDSGGQIRVPVRQLITNTQTVEDVCQDVLIAVAETIASYDGRAKFTTWLHSVARHKAIDTIRRNRPTDELPVDTTRDQQRMSSLIATRQDVRTVLDGLPDEYRLPVTMRDIEQLDYEDIATRLGLPAATVRTRVCRGRAMVAARIRPVGA